MTAVTLESLSRRYRDVTAVNSLDLEIADKEFVVLLGPSGCGKTTTLNMIAGMDAPTEGHILFDGQRVEHVPPERRNIAMVFQSIALYPHKTAFENIAFPLRMAKVPKAEIDSRVRATARLLRIEELLNRRPHELSGGQRQRVALGRAAVRDPLVFLFDEPLSALDAKLRTDMRVELKKLHERLESTFIYVTHDQVEALTMADRIAVMEGGRLRQYATPGEIYLRPADTTVARFVGSPSMNLIAGRLEADGDAVTFRGNGVAIMLSEAIAVTARGLTGEVTFGVRPEGLAVAATGGLPLRGSSSVYALEPLGSDLYVDVTYDRGGEPASLVKMRTSPNARHSVGEPLSLHAEPDQVYLFDREGNRVFPSGSAR